MEGYETHATGHLQKKLPLILSVIQNDNTPSIEENLGQPGFYPRKIGRFIQFIKYRTYQKAIFHLFITYKPALEENWLSPFLILMLCSKFDHLFALKIAVSIINHIFSFFYRQYWIQCININRDFIWFVLMIYWNYHIQRFERTCLRRRNL